MKRYSLLFFAISSFLLAFFHAGESVVSITNEGQGQKANAYALSHPAYPHTELIGHLIQALTAANGSSKVQHLSDAATTYDFTSDGKVFFAETSLASVTSFPSKAYLQHNYPTHNFW